MSGMDMSDMDHGSMPGMLSQAQLRQLDAAQGPISTGSSSPS
jgi:hypothetical protein